MKLRDFIFRDFEFFVSSFVEEEDIVCLRDIMPLIDIYKWGISEPGKLGKVIICADRSGEVARTPNIKSDKQSWTVFFAFTPTKEVDALMLRKLAFIKETWSEGGEILRCCGFEVAMKKDEGLLQLIEHA